MESDMRVIHCADMHLDSKMTANLDPARAKERKAELLTTFTRMVEYGRMHDVDAILIAGDMFDTGTISALTRNTVKDTIINNPDMDFYYLKGNHDRDSFLSSLDAIPANLKLFSDTWQTCPMNDDSSVMLSAIELSHDNSNTCYDALVLDPSVINIVMMHGQETETGGKDRAEIIALRDLKNKNIDYLALGHVHSYKLESLDGRGMYCYPGCLEGRGFDEAGEHGFVMLDIDPHSHTVSPSFVPFASRRIYEVKVDVSGMSTSNMMADRIRDRLKEEDIDHRSLVKIVLTGNVDIEAEKDEDYLLKCFEEDYYFVKISDETSYHVDYSEYALEASLKGEYVRQIQAASDIPESDKADVIRIGLKALEPALVFGMGEL